MFLKNLTITHNSEILRSIDFHKGINLIVDDTDQKNQSSSGNNIGKTTILRLIDYCLDGSAKPIYTDSESKLENNTIKKFLKQAEVTLTLTENLDDDNSPKIVIRRNFLARNEKIFEINNKSYQYKEYSPALSEAIFSFKLAKPTFRQIISKNIRVGNTRDENIFKVLHSAKNEEYEALYLFWLGVPNKSASEQQKISLKLQTENNFLSKLLSKDTQESLKQAIELLDREISDLNKKKQFFENSSSIEKKILLSNQLKEKAGMAKERLSRLTLRKNLIMNSCSELEKNKSHIDTKNIEALYSEAKQLIPNLQKSFEETLSFHNSMQNEKINFIKTQLPSIENEIQDLLGEINQLDMQEKKISTSLNQQKDLHLYSKINLQLNEKHELKGAKEELYQLIKSSKSEVERLEERYSEITNSLENKKNTIEERVTSLNTYFSPLVHELTGESCYIACPQVTNKKTKKTYYQLQLKALEGNPGTGRKKTYIFAFDLAYVSFADINEIKCLHFTLHDQLETVSANQLNTLISLAANCNTQCVIPILKDAFAGKDIASYTILTLSEKDRFFKINN